jgi:CTP synthase
MQARKYIVVVGSLMSGLGKGIITSSIGRILQSKGLSPIPIKFDGYLNVDCGTMNPFRHGEVFVLDDGTECDMDFGTYERFLNIDLNGKCSITGGKLFSRLIEKERRGGFLGRDVQFVPHLTDEIKTWVRAVGEENKADVVLIEVGGTVGDLENGYFIEAMRQLANEEPGSVIFIQLTYLPALSAGEQKTKPTQHANRLIQSMGIFPRIIIVREGSPLTSEAREKISLYCSVPKGNIFDDPDLDTIYQLPIILEKQKFSEVLMGELGLKASNEDMKKWSSLVQKIIDPKDEVNVAIVGKYTAVKDAYVSVKEAIVHAGAHLNLKPNVIWVESTDLEGGEGAVKKAFTNIDAVIVPGGFGTRGTEGKINAAKYCRENKVPYLGLCLGCQLQVVEFARNIAGLKDANSTEFDEKSPAPVIDFLPEQKKIKEKGATMRLGAYDCILKKGTRAHEAYGTDKISERHRHRYEVNPDYRKALEDAGLVISGTSPDGSIVEMVEWKDSFGVSTQAHPELKSRLERPAPLFVALLKEAAKRKKKGA